MKALQGILLQSHPKKMEVIVSGRSQRAENMRERLRKKPAVMQGNHVKVSFSEMYLGIRVSELGFRDTLDQTTRRPDI